MKKMDLTGETVIIEWMDAYEDAGSPHAFCSMEDILKPVFYRHAGMVVRHDDTYITLVMSEFISGEEDLSSRYNHAVSIPLVLVTKVVRFLDQKEYNESDAEELLVQSEREDNDGNTRSVEGTGGRTDSSRPYVVMGGNPTD